MKTNTILSTVAIALSCQIHAATFSLPDIVVTSMGYEFFTGGSQDPEWRIGLRTVSSLGTVAANPFTGGTADNFDTIGVTIRPPAGEVFSLQPGYDELNVGFHFGSGGAASELPVNFAFLGVMGGTIADFSGSLLNATPGHVGSSGSTTGQPSAPITFTGLEISWQQFPGVTFTPSSLTSAQFYTASFSSTEYLSVTPEPSGALLAVVGCACLGLRRRRNQR